MWEAKMSSSVKFAGTLLKYGYWNFAFETLKTMIDTRGNLP